MLGTLKEALHLPKESVEILCSWNGPPESEANINNNSGYEFLIAQRDSYHFAKNVNSLALKASGDILALLNDDVLLDPNSLDAGLSCIKNQSSPTLVGGLLRTPDQLLQHIGFTFDARFNPHHIAEGMIQAKDACDDELHFEVPAVTAAVALVRRDIFSQIRLNESYQRCGEDVEFNLDLRQKLQGHILLCPQLSGIHIESATRAETGEKGNTSEDQVRLRSRRRDFFEQASATQMRVELEMSSRERSLNHKAMDTLKKEQQQLRRDRDHWQQQAQQQLRRDHDHWKRQAQVLQLEVLRLKDMTQRQRED